MQYAGTHLAGTLAAAAVTALVLAPSALAEPGPASVATATPSVIAADWHHGHGPWPEDRGWHHGWDHWHRDWGWYPWGWRR